VEHKACSLEYRFPASGSGRAKRRRRLGREQGKRPSAKLRNKLSARLRRKQKNVVSVKRQKQQHPSRFFQFFFKSSKMVFCI